MALRVAPPAALLVVAIGASGLRPAPVAAAPAAAGRSQAEAKALEAKAYFKQGLYEEAAAAFMEAYAISRAPDMMYNAARAYQEARRPEKARALFKTYLGLDGVSPEGQQDARQRIAVLEAQMAKESVPAEPTPSDPVKPAAAPLAEPASPSSAPSGRGEAADVAPGGVAVGGAPAATDALGWSVLGGGGVLLALSGLAYLGARTTANDANAMTIATPADAGDYNDRFDQAEQVRNLSLGLAAAGVGLAAWGAWRLWLKPGRASAPAALWLAPAPGAGGLAMGGRF